MTDLCINCRERETVAGKFARRCRKCLDAAVGRGTDVPKAGATVVEHETTDGCRERVVYDPTIDGYELTMYVGVADDGWRAVGGESIAELSIDTPE